jgi:hypothetical protein
MKPAKSRYTFIIYTTPSRTPCTGILGTFELCTVQFLLAGGKYLIEEEYDGKDPVKWYIYTLKEQDISVTSSKQQKYKGQNYVWLEVDPVKTPIQEFTIWTEVPDSDIDTLAWRKIMYPCSTETNTECFGFTVVTREMNMAEPKKAPMYLNTILDAILFSEP